MVSVHNNKTSLLSTHKLLGLGSSSKRAIDNQQKENRTDTPEVIIDVSSTDNDMDWMEIPDNLEDTIIGSLQEVLDNPV